MLVLFVIQQIAGDPNEAFNYYGDAARVEDAVYLERKAVTGGEVMHGGDPMPMMYNPLFLPQLSKGLPL